MSKDNLNKITDKELLAICNLSNLKMEFADTALKRDITTSKILSNHTIYSLLEKEITSIQSRKELQKEHSSKYGNKIPDGDYENLKKIYSTFGENMDSSTKKIYLEQKLLRQEEEKVKNAMTKDKHLGVFYDIYKSKKRENIYNTKEELQKEAPIIMEYYDRLNYGNTEGNFLKEWEIIYGGDFYEMLLDYHILNKANIESKNKETSNRIKTQTEKYDFKFNEDFPFREDISSEKKIIQRINVCFDIITSLLSADEFTSYVNKNFTKPMVIKMLELLNKIISPSLQIKTIDENLEKTNLIQELYNLLKKVDNNILGELKVSITLDLLDIRIVIAKNTFSNDFIVSFKSYDSNKIIDDLKKGVLSLDLLTFNALIETIINSRFSKGSEANIYFTGYGDGALLATGCFLLSDFVPRNNSSNSNDKKDTQIIEKKYYNRPFIGAEYPNFLDLVSFNVYDIENISPGSFSYSPNFSQDVLNFLYSIRDNVRSTSNVGLIIPILLKGSIFKGFIGAVSGIGKPVFVVLVAIHFAYAYANRKRLNDIESGFINNKILLESNKYLKIEKDIFKSDCISLKYPLLKSFPPMKIQLIISEESDKTEYSFDLIEISKQNLSETLNYMLLSEEENYILKLCEDFYLKNKEEIDKLKLIEIKEIEIESENRKLYLPLDVTIALFSELSHKRKYFGSKNLISFLSYILYVDDNGKFKYILIRERNILGSFPVYQEDTIRPITSMPEMEIVEMLNFSSKIQEKYKEASDEIVNSEYIYLKSDLSEEDKATLKKISDSFKRDSTIKPEIIYEKSLERVVSLEKKSIVEEETKVIQNENIVYEPKIKRKDMNINSIDYQTKQYIILSKKTPEKTKLLSKLEGFLALPKEFPISEYIYFPYIDSKGNITQDIDEKFIGTLMRSILRYEIKYDALEETKEDAEFESYEFYGTLGKKNKELNSYFLQQIELYGYKYCFWVHYNSVMKLLKEKNLSGRASIIERFYNIEIEDERYQRGNLKVGILDLEKNIYSQKDLGYIYNQDKLSGRAIDVPYYYEYKEDLEEIDTYGVCDKAILKCNCGLKPNVLNVTSQTVEYSDGYLDATEQDKTTPGFIECSKRKGGCKPELKNWVGVSEGIMIEGKKCLLSTSTIECKIGGIISILDPNCKIKNK